MMRRVAGFIFVVLSYLLYLNVSPVKSHCDIDSKAYLERAELFYKTNSFAREGESSPPYFTLGYPLLIGLIFKVCGPSKDAIVLVQVLIALLIGLLLFSIAQRLFNRLVAVIVSLFFAANLGFLVFAQFILTELFLVFFLTLFFERFTSFLISQKRSSLAAAGLALGLSVLIKPAALYFPLMLLPLLWYVVYGSARKKLSMIVLLCVSFFLPIVGHCVHNKIVFGSYSLGSLDQINIYFWFFPHVLAQQYGTNSDIERERLFRLNDKDPFFTSVKTLFKQELMNKPVLFVFVWLKNVFKTCVGLYTTNLKVLVDPNVHGGDISFFRLQGTVWQKINRYIVAGTSLLWVKVVGYLETCWSLMRYVLCLIGLLGLWGMRRYAEFYLFSSYLFYFAMITGHDGCARFRMLFEFILIILAAYGLWLILGRITLGTIGKGICHEKFYHIFTHTQSCAHDGLC